MKSVVPSIDVLASVIVFWDKSPLNSVASNTVLLGIKLLVKLLSASSILKPTILNWKRWPLISREIKIESFDVLGIAFWTFISPSVILLTSVLLKNTFKFLYINPGVICSLNWSVVKEPSVNPSSAKWKFSFFTVIVFSSCVFFLFYMIM